jgi:hypothetical protein
MNDNALSDVAVYKHVRANEIERVDMRTRMQSS